MNSVRRPHVVFALVGAAVVLTTMALIRGQVPNSATRAPDDAQESCLRPKVVMRVYDIRDLMRDVPDFTLTPDLLERELAAMEKRANSNRQIPADLLNQPDLRTNPQPGKSWEQRIEEVVALIHETIEPDAWVATGGAIGSIKENDWRLIVTSTEEVHQRVRALLDEMVKDRLFNVRVRAHWILADRADIEPLLKSVALVHSSGATRPTTDGLRTSAKSSLLGLTVASPAELPKVRAQYRAETLGQDSQRVSVLAVTAHSAPAIGAVMATSDKATVKPATHETLDGAVLDVLPSLSGDRRRALVTIRSQLKDSRSGAAWDPISARDVATTRPAQTSPATAVGTVDVAISAIRRSSLIWDLATTVNVPLGQWVLVGGSMVEATRPADGANAVHSPLQLYLFVEVTAD